MLKEGVGEDHANKDRIAKLLRFASTKPTPPTKRCRWPITLGRMKEGQDKIYYVTAETFTAAKEQPAPRNLPQEGHRSAAAFRARR